MYHLNQIISKNRQTNLRNKKYLENDSKMPTKIVNKSKKIRDYVQYITNFMANIKNDLFITVKFLHFYTLLQITRDLIFCLTYMGFQAKIDLCSLERCPSWSKEHDWKSCRLVTQPPGFESPSLRHRNASVLLYFVWVCGSRSG